VAVATPPRLLVGAANGQAVKAYDGVSGQALGDFTSGGPTTSGPSALALGGPQKHLFVKGWSFPAHTIEEYDGRTGAFVRTLVMAGVETPGSGMDFGPDGRLYAADTSGGISRWDVTTGALVGTFVPQGTNGLQFIGGLRFGPDGNLYVGSFSLLTDRHEVLRFAGGTGASLGGFVAPGSGGLRAPRDLLFSPGGGQSLYVISESAQSGQNGQILRYDGHTGSFIGVFTAVTNPFGLAFGPDGNLYVSIGVSNQVRRYNVNSGALIDVFAMNTNANPTFMLFAAP
jgi:sugar lactone lactonase YvrE